MKPLKAELNQAKEFLYVDSRDSSRAFIIDMIDVMNVLTKPVKMPKKDYTSFNLLA